MTSPKLEEEGVLREWAPLSKFLQQIPLRQRVGVFYEDVKFTCVDATIECIVLGTNCGLIFWYDRSTHYVQVLRLEKGAYLVCCIKVVSTVDFMVAAGDNLGVVSIFKIPKNIDGNQKFYLNFAEKIERYTVDGLHKSKVLALDWSINGQKLFSGDGNGVVVFTEMDFAMNLSKAREIVNERYPIVQLSYNQRHKVLLISSELRCIVWRNQASSGATVTQVGQRERPSLLPLGGTFVCDSSGDISIYSCRGGLKLWNADIDGNVKCTLLFKDALKKCKNVIKLLKPFDCLENSQSTKSLTNEFGKLLPWRDGLFVSYTNHNILVIDPNQVSVISCLLHAKEIAHVCTTRTELFVIGGSRDLIRLGYTPDLCDSSIGGFGNMALGECVSEMPTVNMMPVVGSPLSSSYTMNSYLSPNMANSEVSSSAVTCGVELTDSLPPVVAVADSGVPELRVEPSKYQQYTSVGQQDFHHIVYSQRRPSKHKNRRKSAESIEQKPDRPKPRVISFNGVASYFNDIGKFLNGEFSPSICDGELEKAVPQDILPDMRNMEDIVEDVARKEVLLDAMLESFKSDEIPSDNEPESLSHHESPPGCNSMVETDQSISVDLEKSQLTTPQSQEINSSNNIDEFNSQKANSSSNFVESVIQKAQLSFDDIENQNDLNGIPESTTLTVINPPVCDSSVPPDGKMDLRESQLFEIPLEEEESENIDLNGEMSMENTAPEDFSTDNENAQPSYQMFPCSVSDLNSSVGWCCLSLPEPAASLTSCSRGLALCSPTFRVYTTTVGWRGDSGEEEESAWKLLHLKAGSLFLSPSGSVALKIHCSLAHYSENWEVGSDWKKLGQSAEHGAVTDDKIWLICNGELFFSDLKEGHISNYLSQSSLSKVYQCNKGLLLLSGNGRIFLLENEDWILIRGIKNAKLLSVGPNNLIWAVDSRNNLYVSDNIRLDRPVWWQVPYSGTKDDVIVSLCSTEDGVYICHEGASSILFNKSYVTGHRWLPAQLPYSCSQIAAGAVFEDKGCLWILEKTNKLIALNSSLNVLKEVVAPCNVVCLASAPGALWLLSDDGSVHLRQGISDSNPVGVGWRKLSLEQLHSQIEMVGLSCGPDVVWACDIRGKVVMLVGSPHSIANDTFDPAWVSVEGKPIENNTFAKIYVGPDTFMVWALDNAGNIYVREAVFPTFPLGTGWVLVPHIKASHLTISSDAVYALNRDGVYKRFGISQSNYIGDGWLYLPVELDFISASFDLGLYGVCSQTGQLISHIEREFPFSEHVTVEKDWALL